MIIFHFSDEETEAHRDKITLQGPTIIKNEARLPNGARSEFVLKASAIAGKEWVNTMVIRICLD